MPYMPEDPNAPICAYGTVDPNTGFVTVTPDRLIDALVERLFPSIAEGDSLWMDCASLIDGWKVRLPDATDPAWDAYRAPPEPPEGDEI